jgi:hypothetical protein
VAFVVNSEPHTGARLSVRLFGNTLTSSPLNSSLAMICHTSKNGTVTTRRRAKELAHFPSVFAVTTKSNGTSMALFLNSTPCSEFSIAHLVISYGLE